MKKKNLKPALPRRILAFLLAFVMVAGYIPAQATAETATAVQKEADTSTLDRFESLYGTDTAHAGKVTVDKSVSTADITIDDTDDDVANGTSIALTDSDNFLVTVSQAAQVMALSTQTAVPVDVVFVLDTSGSMSESNRETTMVTAVNNAIKTLMNANSNNRVGVVAFSDTYTTGNNKTGPAAVVLSELASYTGNAADNHLTWKDGNIVGRGTNAGSRDGSNGGTNIQAGVIMGAKMLASATNLTVDGVTRMPFLIILSDGAPTYNFTEETWYNPSMTGSQAGPGNDNGALYTGNGFLPALTAAYYKGVITERYYGANASESNRCYIYTLGVSLDNSDLAKLTMNPKANFNANDTSTKSHVGRFTTYWNKYLSGNGFNISVANETNYTITQKTIKATQNYVKGISSSGKQMYTGGITYNDGYYNATSTSDIAGIFNSVISEISKKAITSPTQVTSTEEFSGYVTFTDVIGEYMEVKDMKGIMANGYFYQGANFAKYLTEGGSDEFNATLQAVLKNRLSGATTTYDELLAAAKESSNQAYYKDSSDYDNSIVWWGKTYTSGDNFETHVQFLAPADNDTVAYIEEQKKADETNSNAIPGEGDTEADVVCRSYFFYGEAGGDVADGDEVHEMMYFIVRVQRSLVAPYQQTVTISAPASLLSVDEVYITEDATGSTPTYTAEVVHDAPARVIYEVGLRSDINAYNIDQIVGADTDYTSETAVLGEQTVSTNYADGKYYFYTNDWNRAANEGSHERAMSKATFYAANNNSYYTYQENTYLYEKSGNNFVPFTENPAGKTLYYYRDVYGWDTKTNSDGALIATKTQIPVAVTIPSTVAGETNALKQDAESKQWYITPGTYTAAVISESEDVYKGSGNKTDTSDVVAHPVRTGDADDSHYTVYLGNNGKLTMEGIDKDVKNVYKNLEGTTYPAEDDDQKIVKPGDILTYTVQVVNHEAVPIDAEVTDKIPAGTVYVAGSASHNADETKNDADTVTGLTWKLNDIPAGEAVTVSFKVEVQEEALHIPTVNNSADVELTLEDGPTYTYTTNTTKNPVEGKTVTMLDGTPITGSVQVGDTLVYTINYVNDSDEEATVTITDSIPKGTHYVENSATNNSANPNITLTTVPAGSNGDQVQSLQWEITKVQPHTEGTVNFSVVVDASAKSNWEANAQPESGDIQISNQASITINNSSRVTNETVNTVQVGDLKISKAVSGNTTEREFTVRLTEAQGKLSGTYVVVKGGTTGTVTFANGISGDITIKAGETLLIKGLPDNTDISVTELPSTGYTPSYSSGGRVTVDADKTGESAVGVEVTNTYTPVGVTFQLKGSKTINGNNFPDATFTFVARSCSATGEVNGDREVIAYASTADAANGVISFNFSPREFTAATSEPLYYLITEEVTEAGKLTGVTYSNVAYLMKLEIKDVGNDGTLDAVVTMKTGTTSTTGDAWNSITENAFDWNTDAVAFTNTYAPVSTTVTISGTKTLNNRDLHDGEFSFLLVKPGAAPDEDTVIATAYNVNGSFTFDPITYTAADMADATDSDDADSYPDKTFTYYVKEVQGDLSNVTYDNGYYVVKVKITEKDGRLTVDPDGNGDDITYEKNGTSRTSVEFINEFAIQDVSVTLSGTKTLSGEGADGLDPEDFTFVVVEAEKNGSTYTEKETVVATAGNGQGTKAEGVYTAPITFSPINYTPSMMTGADESTDSAGHILTKEFYYIVKELVPADSEPSHDIHMYYSNAKYGITVTVTYDVNAGQMNAVITDINGTAQSNADNSFTGANFVNVKNLPYEELTLQGTKTTKHQNPDGTLPAGLRFSFRVVNVVENSSVAGTGMSAPTDGGSKSETKDITFTKLVYSYNDWEQHKDKNGVATFEYWVMESNAAAGSSGTDASSDANSESSNSGNGVVYSTVKYKVVVELTRVNRELKATATYYADNDADGVYDDEVEGKISFNNTYNAQAQLNLTAKKELTGRDLKENEFDFRLQRLVQSSDNSSYTILNADAAVNGTNAAATKDSENKATGTVSFATLNFSDAMLSGIEYGKENQVTDDTTGDLLYTEKTRSTDLYYLMSEIKPAGEEIPGVVYDDTKYIVTITLTETMRTSSGDSTETSMSAEVTAVHAAAGTGTYTLGDAVTGFTSPDTNVTFHNTYSVATGTKATITATKTLTGRTMQENEFSFELYRWTGTEEVLVETATNKDVDSTTNSSTVTFTRTYPATMSDTFFTEDGTATFIYHMVEVNTGKGGVKYNTDNKDYWIKVVVKHDTDKASLVVDSITYYDAYNTTNGQFGTQITDSKDVVFKNTYSTNEALYQPKATKALLSALKDNSTDRNVVNGDYSFSYEVIELNNDGTSSGKVAAIGNSGANGAVTFTNIVFADHPNVDGQQIHYYQIREIQGNAEGVTYTDQSYYLKMTVYDDGEGTLTVLSAEYSNTFNGTAVYKEEFATISTGDGKTTVTVKNTAEITGTVATFTNYYGPGKISLNLGLSKYVNVVDANRVYELKGSEFDFEVYAYSEDATDHMGALVTYGTNGPSNSEGVADIIFGDIVINKSQLTNNSGVFKYVVKEVARTDAGSDNKGIQTDSKLITVTVTVTDDGYGNLSATYSYSDNDNEDNVASRFVNQYDADPVSVEILVNKTLENRDIQDGMFTFALYEMDQNGSVSSTPLETVSNKGGQAKFDVAVVEKLKFQKEGTYYFLVKEQAEGKQGFTYDSAAYTVVVEVKDNLSTGKLSAEVSYYKDYVATADEGTNLPNKVGSIEFLNSYMPQPLSIDLSGKIDATKTVVGANGEALPDKAEGFEFEVLYSNGQPVVGADGEPITGKSNEDGNIEFSEFKFTLPGEYVYRIHEKEVTATGYTMDTRVWEVRIQVRYNRADGELYIGDNDVTTFLLSDISAQAEDEGSSAQLQAESAPDFVNVYVPLPTTLTLYAQKNLEGRELKDHEFTFHLMENGLIVAEGKNHGEVVPFTVTYTEVGTYNYTVKEHKPETAEPGINYDTNTYTVTVEVTDKDGQLVAKVVDGTADLIATFNNSYIPDPVTVPITAQKVLQGGKLAAGRFAFELESSDGKIEVVNAADGSITFEVTYSHEDMVDEANNRVTEKEFTYELREKKGNVTGMTYDDTKYTVTVKVVDDLNGKLHASVSYSDIPVFTNIYDGKDAFEVVTAQKVLDGRALKNGEFTFELVDENGNVTTATNDAQGNVVFSELQFSSAGTHTYTLREKAGNEPNMTYDPNTNKVTITVTEDDNGDFNSTLKYDTADGKAPVFKNVYTPDAVKVQLEATKVLTGRDMKAEEFKFQIHDSHGNLVGTGANAADGKIVFTDVTLPVAGQYELTVTEVDQGETYMTYDTAKFQVVVNVGDNDNDGILTAEVKYPEGGIKFQNTYEEPEPTTVPTTEPEPSKPSAISPETGDNTPLGLLVGVMAVSVIAIAVLLILKKKKGKYSK